MPTSENRDRRGYRRSASGGLARAAWVALWLGMAALSGWSQETVLVREIQSREVGLLTGASSVPEFREVISREVGLAVGQGPANPYSEVTSREVGLVNSDAAPPPRVGRLTISGSATGETATLDWSSYDPWRVGDITRFDIYLSDDGPIVDVAGRTPIRSVGGETTEVTLTGLAAYRDHFFAVVPVDALGGYDTVVNYGAAYVLSSEIVSREVGIMVESGNPGDTGGLVSREVGLVAWSPEPPPRIARVAVSTSPTGDDASLDWSGYDQWAVGDIVRFDIYVSDEAPFESVAGRTPVVQVPVGTTSHRFEGLTTWKDRYFAVVPVDAAGRFEPVVNYTAGYILSREVVSREVGLSVESGASKSYSEVVSREVAVVVPDGKAPTPVTGLGRPFSVETSTTSLGAVEMDWTGYDEISEFDVLRYRIYVGNAFFDDVTGLMPYGYVPAGVRRHTLTGLSGGAILHFAVVAEDAGGVFDPIVRSHSAQASVSGVGEVASLAVRSESEALEFSWEAPIEGRGFLAGYRIRFGGTTDPVDLPASTVNWRADGLVRAHGYPFRISTLDVSGRESGGASLVAATWLPNPSGVALTAVGETARLVWSAVEPRALVGRYAIFRAAAPILDVTALVPIGTTTGASFDVGTLTEVTGWHFAVSTVNISDGRDPAVRSVSGSKQRQTMDFPVPSVHGQVIPLSALASSGLPVVFSASPSDVAVVDGTMLRVLQGGEVTVTARQSGDEFYWPVESAWSLRLPPVIRSFAADGVELVPGTTLASTFVDLSVVAVDREGLARVEFYRRAAGTSEWSPWATDTNGADGWSARVSVASIPRGEYDLRVVVVTASGIRSERVVTVVEVDRPALALSAGSTTLIEGTLLTVDVSRDAVSDEPTVVTLVSSAPDQLSPPGQVTIPAGASSARFTVLAVDDVNAEAPMTIRLDASAPRFVDATLTLSLEDNDVTPLTVALSATSVGEGSGNAALSMTVTRNPAGAGPLAIEPYSSDGGAVILPQQIVIPGGQTTRSFPVGVVDDALVNGSRTLRLGAYALATGTGNRLREATPASLTILDDDGPALTLVAARKVVREGVVDATEVTVSRNTPPGSDLNVKLTSSDPGEARVPAEVTIPAGAESATFLLESVADGIQDGSRSVTLTASAAGHGSGVETIVVSDIDLPDLIVTSLAGPASGKPGQRVSMSFRVLNQGVGRVTQAVLNRVYLSTDPTIGDDVLAAQSQVTTRLEPGGSVERSETITLPPEAGRFWLICETDAARELGEILEDNNVAISAAPIVVEPDYDAWVRTDVESDLAGSVVPLYGGATNGSGDPMPHVPVRIHLWVRGVERELSATTDATGRFAVDFRPLPGEGGDYGIYATHPAVSSVTVQDRFTLIGFRPLPATQKLFVVEGGTSIGTIDLENLADVALHGLAVEVIETPAGLRVVPDLAPVPEPSAGDRRVVLRSRSGRRLAGEAEVETPAVRTDVARVPAEGRARGLYSVGPAQMGGGGPTLPALGGLRLGVEVTALAADGSGPVKLRVTTSEGIAQDVELVVRVVPLAPRLVANPPNLDASMVVGAQTMLEFELANLGGRASGPVTVALPDLPWLTVVSPNPIADLEPGRTNRVALRLAPSANLPLGPHTGNMLVSSAGSSVAIPFHFRAVSEAKGDLIVDVVDEYTYYAAGGPHLAGATVTVRDSFSQEVVATGTSGADGRFVAEGLAVAYYDIEVTAEKHSPFRATRLLKAGVGDTVVAFLSRQAVTYNWTVEPITLEDRYRITIDTTFETMVPMPVITVDPTVVDLATLTDDETQIDVRITNHGLIAALNVRLRFPTDPLWEFSPLVDELGTLPARTELRVPLIIRRLGTGGDASRARAGAALAGGGGGPCGFVGDVLWDLVCLTTNTYGAGIQFPNARAGCGGIPWAWGEGGGGALPVGYRAPSIATKLPCDPCLAKAAVDCAIGLSPMGDAYGWAQCLLLPSTLSSDAIEDCLLNFIPSPIRAPIGCAWGFLRCVCKGSFFSVPGCVRDLVQDLFSGAGDGRALAGGTSRAPDALSYFAALNFPAIELHQLLVDDPEGRWLEPESRAAGHAWYAAFRDRIRTTSESGTLVSEAEAAELRASGGGGTLTIADFDHAIERWNRSISNWRSGVFEVGQLPPGGDANFITISALRRIAENLSIARSKARESGYDTPELAFRATLSADDDRAPEGGVCARVKLRLEQEAVLARDAFRATLELDNDGDSRVENVGVEVVVTSESGVPAGDLFGLRFDGVTTLSAIDGTGILAARSTGQARWTLIPSVDAAPQAPTRYLVGGTLRYRLDGTDVVIDMTPVPIVVHPAPRLSLQYFHQRDVYSDDPFTDPIEPALPYSLGVLVRNRGFGLARDFRITSAEPRIIENEKGLLIDFDIIATELYGPGGASSLSPSLSVSFGDLRPGESAVGRWLFLSSLQGLFIDYTATWEHVDGLGNPRLSLIDEVSIHEAVRVVRAGGIWDDGRPDFLVNDIPDARDRPDTLYHSTGATNRVEAVEAAVVSGRVELPGLSVSLSTEVPPAWVYLRIPDPGQGQYRLVRVVRSDGTEIAVGTNAWTTDRTFVGLARRPIQEAILHVLDYDSTGRYTLEYAEGQVPLTDDVPPTSTVEPLPGSTTPWFQVRWSGRDEGRLGETASGLAAYDVWVSESGGPFVPWLTGTKLVSVTYPGLPDVRYAFYSVAIDAAGNREAPPTTPDAETTTSRGNTAPAITAPTIVTIDEGTMLDVTITASDADDPEQRLSFSLAPGHPPGMAIDAESGRLTWPTGEADGGTTRSIGVVVTDNGLPARSASRSVEVRILEVNTPPITVSDRIVHDAGRRVRFPEARLVANDLDVDGDHLRLVDVSTASARGGSVRRIEGWISYVPPAGDGPGDDWFVYTISDGTAESTGVVEVTSGAASDEGSLNLLGASIGPDGHVRLELVGIPGRTYEIQFTTGLTDRVWTTLGTTTADANGRCRFVHASPPLGSAFYRAFDPAGRASR